MFPPWKDCRQVHVSSRHHCCPDLDKTPGAGARCCGERSKGAPLRMLGLTTYSENSRSLEGMNPPQPSTLFPPGKRWYNGLHKARRFIRSE